MPIPQAINIVIPQEEMSWVPKHPVLLAFRILPVLWPVMTGHHLLFASPPWKKKLAFTVYIHNNFLHGQSCPRGNGAMRLTLGEAPSYTCMKGHTITLGTTCSYFKTLSVGLVWGLKPMDSPYSHLVTANLFWSKVIVFI